MIKQRTDWVDSVKYIAIMCIMGNHMAFMNTTLYAAISPLYLMPFFFCSGYTYKNRPGFKALVKNKARQLLIPWLILGLANILLAQVISFNVHLPLREELILNFLQVRGKYDGLWFFAALFVAFIPFYFFVKWYHSKETTRKRTVVFLAVAFVLSLLSGIYMQVMDPSVFRWNSPALPWHLEFMFEAMFFMVLGYLFRHRWEGWFDAHDKLAVLIGAVVLYLLVVYLPQPDALTIPLTYCKQLLGVYILVSLSKRIKPNRYMRYIGQNTLLCFGLHGKLCSLLGKIIQTVSPALYGHLQSNALYSTVAVAACAVVLSLILIVPIWLINRYIPFVAGRKKA